MKMHHCDSEYAPLCNLINKSLSPLSQQHEKYLLTTLSQISKTIRDLENEEDDTDSDNVTIFSSNGYRDCFAHIVCQLTNLLEVESKFVRHSTGNVLATVSSLLTKTYVKWEVYLRLLCTCLVVSMSSVLTSRISDSSSLVCYVQDNIVNSNWYTITSLVRVLRVIVKNMKQCPDYELMKIYLNCINDTLESIRWELLNEVHVAQESLSGEFDSAGPLYEFIGTLLQLLCSLLHQSTCMEVSNLNEHPVMEKITSLVPQLLCWCFHKEDYILKNGSDYLKHKNLMLMIRLNFRVHQDSSLLVLWLRLLHEYFEDLLYQPISQSHSYRADCLDGSPFLSCVSDGKKVDRTYISHLQRQAIFLFLNCSTSLIALANDTGTKRSCSIQCSCLGCDLHSDQEPCFSRRGLLEISEWLNRHMSLDVFVNYELYLGKCSRFTFSFLQLYMDEDDFLFEVLLCLSTLPLPVQMDREKKENKFEEVKGDILFHLSNIFNTVHLFHLFLAQLNYDHSVLLDYLISKDAGVHCLQYLLRCMRAVSKSWNLFLQFPVCGNETVLFSYKKRKLSGQGSDFDGEVDLASETGTERKYPGLFHSNREANCEFGSTHSDTRKSTFQKAKICLFSLKETVKNLHQKNLFPYNPAALLRSFTRFQELCDQQQSVLPYRDLKIS